MLAISPLSRLAVARRHRADHEVEWCIEIPSIGMEIDILVEFDFRKGHPGRVYGPPEDCFPAEADELEFVRVTGLNSGVDCMAMLERETRPVHRYYGYGPREITLLECLRESMIEHVRD